MLKNQTYIYVIQTSTYNNHRYTFQITLKPSQKKCFTQKPFLPNTFREKIFALSAPSFPALAKAKESKTWPVVSQRVW